MRRNQVLAACAVICACAFLPLAPAFADDAPTDSPSQTAATAPSPAPTPAPAPAPSPTPYVVPPIVSPPLAPVQSSTPEGTYTPPFVNPGPWANTTGIEPPAVRPPDGFFYAPDGHQYYIAPCESSYPCNSPVRVPIQPVDLGDGRLLYPGNSGPTDDGTALPALVVATGQIAEAARTRGALVARFAPASHGSFAGAKAPNGGLTLQPTSTTHAGGSW